MKNLNSIDWLALVLTIIGGINWGLVGLMGYNLVESIFGTGTSASNIIYAVVGISALYLLLSMLTKSSTSRVREAV